MIRHAQGKSGKHTEPTEAEKQNMVKMKNVMTEFLKFRQGFEKSNKSFEELLEYSLQMMHLSTDSPTIFNFRKDLIGRRIEELVSAGDAAEERVGQLAKLVQGELKELFKMAAVDPKSYEIWYHRIWTIQRFVEAEKRIVGDAATLGKQAINEDLMISAKYLSKDERNFHVWNYRLELNKLLMDRWPADKKAVIDKELKYVLAKLNDNFSNYSAIQFFTKYVEMKLASAGEEETQDLLQNVVLPQMEAYVSNLVLSPKEQASWLFQLWLIARLNPPALIWAKRLSAKEIQLVFNRQVDSNVLRKTLTAGDAFAVKKKHPNIVLLTFQNDFSGDITYHILSQKCVLKIGEIGENLTLVSDSQTTAFEKQLTEFQANLSEIEVNCELTAVLHPITAFHLKRELVLNRFYTEEKRLTDELEKLFCEFGKSLSTAAKTNYAQMLLETFTKEGLSLDAKLEHLASV